MRQPNRWGSSALRIGGWVGLSLAVAAALAAVVQRLGTRTPGGRPNVLLITIDTLRADRLGCYGAATRTPNVDRLAREGTLFENAACPVPATRPSHLSIFTSRYPREIGVVDNALAMPSGLVTLPEVFKSNGYRTAGFVGVSLLNPQSGAARGFDTFDFPHPQQQRNAEVVVPQALEWLRTATERPFFLWVHLFDPHMPYAPPPQYAPAAPIDWVRELPQVTWQRLLALADRHGGDLPSAALSRALSLYSGEVEKTDYWVGVLLDTLRARGVLDQTVVALTADHGECFEHGIFFEHYGCLYEGAAHVPLIVRYAAKVAAGERRRGIAEHVDLAPTLLALAGLPVPEAFVGRPLFNQHGTGKQYAVVQHPTYPQDAVALRRARLARMRQVGGVAASPLLLDREQYALRGEIWKYIVTGTDEELYDITTDGGEERNVAPHHPDVLAALRVELQQWRAAHPARASKTVPMTNELRESLRALGY